MCLNPNYIVLSISFKLQRNVLHTRENTKVRGFQGGEKDLRLMTTRPELKTVCSLQIQPWSKGIFYFIVFLIIILF